MATTECATCGSTQEQKTLAKCAICHKMYCEDCAATMSGRRFCSQFCAEYFFHGGEDDI